MNVLGGKWGSNCFRVLASKSTYRRSFQISSFFLLLLYRHKHVCKTGIVICVSTIISNVIILYNGAFMTFSKNMANFYDFIYCDFLKQMIDFFLTNLYIYFLASISNKAAFWQVMLHLVALSTQ